MGDKANFTKKRQQRFWFWCQSKAGCGVSHWRADIKYAKNFEIKWKKFQCDAIKGLTKICVYNIL